MLTAQQAATLGRAIAEYGKACSATTRAWAKWTNEESGSPAADRGMERWQAKVAAQAAYGSNITRLLKEYTEKSA